MNTISSDAESSALLEETKRPTALVQTAMSPSLLPEILDLIANNLCDKPMAPKACLHISFPLLGAAQGVHPLRPSQQWYSYDGGRMVPLHSGLCIQYYNCERVTIRTLRLVTIFKTKILRVEEFWTHPPGCAPLCE